MIEKKRGRKNYVHQIEENYPRLLHQLFRQSQQIIGYDATFKELASSMNNISLLEFNVILSLTYHHFRVFFKKNKGKKLFAKEKPRLTDDQKKQRKEWAAKMLENIQDPNFVYCFLDEKWFCTSTYRRKLK